MDAKLPHAFVINMKSRPDRWKHIQKEFGSLSGCGLDIERIEGPHTKPGWKGCALAHRTCIELAKQRRYPWVLVLEDDATLSLEARKRFKDLLPLLWETRKAWDIFNGGFSTVHTAYVLEKSPPLFLATGWGAHFCLIPASSYDKILHLVKKNPDMGIDNYYSQPIINMICTYPHLSEQIPGKSDNWEKYINYSSSFKRANKILGKVLEKVE